MILDIRHIRTLIAVADEGSFTRAAIRLGIPQPALSAQIKRIERAIGAKLFDRSTRNVSHTADLKVILPHLRAVNSAMFALEGAVKNGSQNSLTPSNLGLASADLVDLLEELCDRSVLLPRLVLSDSDYCIRELHRGRLDIVQTYDVTAAARPAAPLRTVTVAEEPLGVLLPRGHRLAERPVVSLVDLACERWVAHPPGDRPHDLLVDACRTLRFTPQIVYHTTAEAIARELVRGHGCVCLGSEFFLHDGICARPLDVSLTRRVVVAWNTEKCSDAMAETFCEALRTWFSEMAIRRNLNSVHSGLQSL